MRWLKLSCRFAESDPSADVEGQDAASKAAIIAMVVLELALDSDVTYEGITQVSAEDIDFAKRFGHTIKTLAIAEHDNGEVAVRVHPAMVRWDSSPIGFGQR